MLLIIRSPFVAIPILFLKGLAGLRKAKSWLLINPPDGDVHLGMCTVMVHLSVACSPSLTFITGRQTITFGPYPLMLELIAHEQTPLIKAHADPSSGVSVYN